MWQSFRLEWRCITERERLLQLIEQAEEKFPTMCDLILKMTVEEYVVDYLISNDIIVPPVKVGDTVYIRYQKKIYPVTVYAIRVDTKTNSKRICVEDWLQIDEYYQHSYTATFKWESIGKTVFLTREEAEEASQKQKEKKNE